MTSNGSIFTGNLVYILISFFMAIAPSIFLVWYFRRLERRKPEPKQLVLKIFFIGIVSTIPLVMLGPFFRFLAQPLKQVAFFYILARAFILTALFEEWIKLRVVKEFAYRNVVFDGVMDGIIYAVTASLGFACFENVVYVFKGGLQVGVIRAVCTVPLHIVASGLMGYYIGKSKFCGYKKEQQRLINKGFFLAVMVHGVYNFVLSSAPIMSNALLTSLVFLLLIGSWVSLFLKIRSISQEGN